MALQQSLPSFPALAVALLVVFSGCAGMQFGETDMSADEIGEKVEQKYENIGTFTGTVTTKIVTGNETRTTKANVWINQSASEMRYEYVAPESQNGTILVKNESAMWTYNETTNTVRKTNISSLGTQGMSQNYQQLVETVLENYNVSYRGTETVGNRSTYVLSLVPKSGSSLANITQNYTLWIDKDSWFPVKRHMVSSFGNQTYETTTTYSNLTLDANVSDDTFEFRPPEDAEVVETEMPDTQKYDTVDVAETDVSFDVTEPREVPEDYELGNVTVTAANNYTVVSLSYQNDTDHLYVRQSNRTDASRATNDDAENVTIDGREGTYAEYSSTGIVRWTCGDESYSVSGSLPKSELLAVAESIDCT
ncbi:outer membrane lipoprotein-sorting protein [Halorussus aquaticus]|uniref:Outer membrane lipoprotein-sorting protein n=1 Tax=Halorussus aquaticus TaxID=2953748 RepID=A0ABD5Q336_9EURY|nr:outer membrane lipoprotein-sorting protein [Halorussus aquaticus]